MAYDGGKGGAGTQRIINLMPPHRRYIKPFLGAGGSPSPETSGARPEPRHRGRPGRYRRAPGRRTSCSHRRGLAGTPLTVICADGMQRLRERRYGIETQVYCDPTYLRTSRTSRRDLYRHELIDANHGALPDAICDWASAGKMMLDLRLPREALRT